MTPEKKLLLRQAMQLHEQFCGNHSTTGQFHLPHAAWEECQATAWQMIRSRKHGWHLAAARLAEDLRSSLANLRSELMTIEALLPSPDRSSFSTLGSLHADLVALHQEFPAVNFDRRQRTLSVTTEPIELEEVYLGPFEIRLNWTQAIGSCAFNYQFIAEDPQPAASNESITHPHVQSETLCEGDGRHAIQLALEQHRLLDFFLIVDNILKTYNSSSPYVALADWYGLDCADCGSTISSDGDRWICDKCGAGICDVCYTICPDCDESFCSDCITRCARCEEYHCDRCISECTACQAVVCQECLNEQELCTECQQKAPEETGESGLEEENGANHPAEPALQSHRLGETAVSA
jgi:hypothetical protein